MRVKVELHSRVDLFVRKSCTKVEQNEFYRMLEALRTNPISESEAMADPLLSRYMLRFFRFGPNLAIFEWDAGCNRMGVTGRPLG